MALETTDLICKHCGVIFDNPYIPYYYFNNSSLKNLVPLIKRENWKMPLGFKVRSVILWWMNTCYAKYMKISYTFNIPTFCDFIGRFKFSVKVWKRGQLSCLLFCTRQFDLQSSKCSNLLLLSGSCSFLSLTPFL